MCKECENEQHLCLNCTMRYLNNLALDKAILTGYIRIEAKSLTQGDLIK